MGLKSEGASSPLEPGFLKAKCCWRIVYRGPPSMLNRVLAERLGQTQHLGTQDKRSQQSGCFLQSSEQTMFAQLGVVQVSRCNGGVVMEHLQEMRFHTMPTRSAVTWGALTSWPEHAEKRTVHSRLSSTILATLGNPSLRASIAGPWLSEGRKKARAAYSELP